MMVIEWTTPANGPDWTVSVRLLCVECSDRAMERPADVPIPRDHRGEPFCNTTGRQFPAKRCDGCGAGS